jgi:signal transduction histidine kinase
MTAPAAKSPTWHRVYYALGAFNVVSVLAAIALSYIAMSGFSESIAVNEEWADRLGHYSELAQMASRADAPGNDVFETQDVDGEVAHLATYRAAFERDYQAAVDELTRNTSPTVSAPLIGKLAAAHAAFELMMHEADLTFAAFRGNDRGAAGQHMAAMDRQFSVTSEALTALLSEVRNLQQSHFAHQEAQSGSLRVLEYLLAGLVVLIVAAIVAYGRKLAMVFAKQQATIDARNRDMRLVLDHVAQGFLTINSHGVISNERSAVVDRWFGVAGPDTTLPELLCNRCPGFAASLELGLGELREDIMPAALVLDQLPRRFDLATRIYDVAYTPIHPGAGSSQTEGGEAGAGKAPARIEQLLVVISDVTELVAREISDREQGEMVRIFQRISVDRSGVEEFLLEAGSLVTQLRDEQDPVVQKRIVHTLKGNCAIYGLSSYATLAQHIEAELSDTGGGLLPEQRATLEDVWRQAMHRVAGLLGSARRDVLEVDPRELDAAIQLSTSRELSSMLESWRREPVSRRFDRLATQVAEVARRLGKPEPTVDIRSNGIRMEAAGRTAFWAAMIHVVRNAVDHGIEDEQARVAAGKPSRGQIVLSAMSDCGRLVLRVADDGRGIDWEQVRARARAMGLPCATARDLSDAVFHDGLSTRDSVSELSGRGVGLAALAEVVAQLGGEVSVESTAGRGTTVIFTFDEAASQRVGVGPRSRLSSLVPQFS